MRILKLFNLQSKIFNPYRLLPPCRDTQQYTYTQQTDYQRRSSIAEQQESQSLGGQQTHYNAHIYNDLESDHCADAHTQIAAVKIGLQVIINMGVVMGL